MRVVVIGATGTIGAPVVDLLSRSGHEVIGVSRNSDPRVNLDEPASIDAFYDAIGEADGVLSIAGNAAAGPLGTVTDEQLGLCLRSKLLGQVNVVRKGFSRVKPGGVIVITGGMLAYAPWPNTSPVAMVNAGLEGFARAAALEMQDGRRVVIVHPPLVRETAAKWGRDETPWPQATAVANAYKTALEGTMTGVPVFVDGYGPTRG
ncbi:MAG: short chain dehydrogenase [Acidobacteriota bacterium]